VATRRARGKARGLSPGRAASPRSSGKPADKGADGPAKLVSSAGSDPHSPPDQSKPRDPVRGWFGEKSVRIWTVVAGVAGVGALVAGLLQIWPSTPSADVKIVNVAVQKPSSVDATVYSETDDKDRSKGNVDATVIDVTVKNVGSIPAVILEASFAFRFAEEMQNCPGGGDAGLVSGEYAVVVPTLPPPRPFTINRGMRYVLEPGKVNRFTFSIGPAVQRDANEGGPWLYAVDGSLRIDEMPKLAKLGTVAIVAQPHMLIQRPDPGFDASCLTYNQSLMARLAKIDAIRSTELTQAIKEWTSYVPRPAATAPSSFKVCAEGKPMTGQLSLKSVCYSYTKSLLSARFILSGSARPNMTQVMIRITTSNGEKLIWATRYRGETWTVGFVADDDPASLPWAGSGCDIAPASRQCTVGSDSQGITIAINLEMGRSLDYPSLDLVAEIQNAPVGQSPTVLSSVPAIGHLTVAQGSE
jgi:hypothetical protein